jgi:hypothetical protein
MDDDAKGAYKRIRQLLQPSQVELCKFQHPAPAVRQRLRVLGRYSVERLPSAVSTGRGCVAA